MISVYGLIYIQKSKVEFDIWNDSNEELYEIILQSGSKSNYISKIGTRDVVKICQYRHNMVGNISVLWHESGKRYSAKMYIPDNIANQNDSFGIMISSNSAFILISVIDIDKLEISSEIIDKTTPSILY